MHRVILPGPIHPKSKLVNVPIRPAAVQICGGDLTDLTVGISCGIVTGPAVGFSRRGAILPDEPVGPGSVAPVSADWHAHREGRWLNLSKRCPGVWCGNQGNSTGLCAWQHHGVDPAPLKGPGIRTRPTPASCQKRSCASPAMHHVQDQSEPEKPEQQLCQLGMHGNRLRARDSQHRSGSSGVIQMPVSPTAPQTRSYGAVWQPVRARSTTRARTQRVP